MGIAVERLDFRLAPRDKALIEQAAAAAGESLTDFALKTLTRRARKILRDQQLLVLSDRDRDLFLKALDDPPAPNSALRKAARQHRDAVKSGRLRHA